jgi:hypothetical protein
MALKLAEQHKQIEAATSDLQKVSAQIKMEKVRAHTVADNQ